MLGRLQGSIILISLLIGSTLLSSCGSSGTEETANTITPQIFVFPGEQELRLISEEPITQNNCDGSAVTSQTIEKQHRILYSLELGSGIKVSAEGRAKIPEIGEVGVGAEVATNYKVGYGQEETVSRSVTVAAKEGTNIQHTIRQYEVWETGEILVVSGEVNQRLPYSFRRDFSIEALPPANIGCATSSSTSSEDGESSTVTEASATTATEEPTSPPLGQVPLRDHTPFSAGDGVFANVTVSDGQADFSTSELDTNHQHIQGIRLEEQPDGCAEANYASDHIWVTGTPGMTLNVNGQEVGTYRIAPDFHGYMLDFRVNVGDQLCAVNFGAVGFSVIFGPDVYYHYDSYCHRFGC